ncbi:hypothetical protein N825_10395 [Skermanella stibiiresistens SB22]|uniref:Uncharacterized protein n=2 Tax=Skermanella TaxID=204447 RepID=W9GYE9_9PROT|nr:hypothetical protein N825_10395 [Skermanella stibiiresistens SB22]
MLTSAARAAMAVERGEGRHGRGPLSQDLEQAREVFRDLGIDRQRRPLILPKIQVAACETFE